MDGYVGHIWGQTYILTLFAVWLWEIISLILSILFKNLGRT